ncbi:hypothetical protein K439DRAFT_1620803 [Ramaria rubella]|nr:hypothetical protein K439DRAFT_1620803 [Ramaria rubella]
MSSQEELAALIQEQSDGMAFNYVEIAAFTYDTLLTFPTEVRFIWHKKFRLGTMLYLLARYSALLEVLLTVYLDFAVFPSLQLGITNRTCNSVLYLTHAVELLPPVGVQGLLFARAYAISSHKQLIFVVLALLGTIAIVLSMIATPNDNCISISNLFVLCKILNLFSEAEFMVYVSVTTLNSVVTILFDTAVLVAILQNTLGLLQLWRGIPGLQRHSLSKLLVQQGILRYGFVLTITLADAVTNKVLRPTLQGILGPLQNCLSVIIICHFHLDLQQRNDHPNASNTSQSLSLGSFHAVKERIHRTVVDEFGDLSFNGSFGTGASQEDIELQGIQSSSGVGEIDVQEFPWARGDIGDEEAGPMASGSGILRK